MWEVRGACQVEDMHVVEHFDAVEPADDEYAAVGDDGGVVASWEGWFACDGAGFEGEGDCVWKVREKGKGSLVGRS